MKFVDIHTHLKTDTEDDLVRIISYYQTPSVEPSDFFSIGIHPWYLNEHLDEKWFIHPLCVAIGECGLDKVRSSFSIEDQQKVFHQHLVYAQYHKKPVILHVVRAYVELMNSIKQFPHLIYIWHGFGGNYELFKQFEKFNMFVSFGFRGAKNLGWKQIPIDRVLMETDDSSKKIQDVYLTYAKITGYSLDFVIEKVYHNAERALGRLV
ncbi:MAG: TatD family hydrolase [Bacteroidales bacterium]|nr:TatD family hydrolase [Bacteroidales bacterium]